jgi:acetolactate synthase regulatory subunit
MPLVDSVRAEGKPASQFRVLKINERRGLGVCSWARVAIHHDVDDAAVGQHLKKSALPTSILASFNGEPEGQEYAEWPRALTG